MEFSHGVLEDMVVVVEVIRVGRFRTLSRRMGWGGPSGSISIESQEQEVSVTQTQNPLWQTSD